MQKLILAFFLGTLIFACSDPCDDVNCGANGTCDEETGNCICDEWVEGNNCETETRTKFLGTWNSTSICQLGSMNDSPTWTIETSANLNNFILRSPDVLSNRIIEATLTANNDASLTPFTLGTSEFSGSINFINETTMAMTLEVADATGGFTCDYAMSR